MRLTFCGMSAALSVNDIRDVSACTMELVAEQFAE